MMDINHIQLNTMNVEAAARFYDRFFDFKTQKKHGDGLFLWNSQGFMMAINPLPENPVFPSWFHIGFRFNTIEEVKSLYSKLVDADCPMNAELQEFDDFAFFRCVDPTGYVVEVFWEPTPNTNSSS